MEQKLDLLKESNVCNSSIYNWLNNLVRLFSGDVETEAKNLNIIIEIDEETLKHACLRE